MKLDAYDALELDFDAVIDEEERHDWLHSRAVLEWSDEEEELEDEELARYHLENAWRDEITAAQATWLLALRLLGPGFVALGIRSAWDGLGEMGIALDLLGIMVTALAWFGPRAYFSIVTNEGRRLPRVSSRSQVWGFLLTTTALAILGFMLVTFSVLH